MVAANSGVFGVGELVTSGGPLEVHLWRQDPSTGAIIEVTSATASPGVTTTVAMAVFAGEAIYVEGKGAPIAVDVMAQGTYDFQFVLV